MKKTWRLAAYAVGGVVAVWLTAKFFLPVGLPFLLGFGLSRLAEPLVSGLTRSGHVPRWLASFLCVSGVFAGIGLLLWLLGKMLCGELARFATQLPSLLESLAVPVGKLHGQLVSLAGRLPDGIAAAVTQWLDSFFEGSGVVLDSMSGWLIGIVTGTLSSLPDIVLFVLTVLLSSYLISSELPHLREAAGRHLPPAWSQRGHAIVRRLKSAFGGYCKAQFRLMLVTFGIVAAGLLLLRRDHALLFGFLIAVVDALPVFGSGTVLVPWAVFALLRGDNPIAIGLLLTYGVASLTRTFLEPRFLGHQIGLNPLLTLLSLYAGYRLFGILGMVLLPVAVILFKQIYDLFESTERGEAM